MTSNTPTYEIQPKDYTYPCMGENAPLDFSGLCAVSANEHMHAMSTQLLKAQPYGMTMLRYYLSGHGVPHLTPVSYAGVKGFVEHGDIKRAMIGSILTLPSERNKGFATAVVKALCEVVSTKDAIQAHGHNGLLARCNETSQHLLQNLGFTAYSNTDNGVIMFKDF